MKGYIASLYTTDKVIFSKYINQKDDGKPRAPGQPSRPDLRKLERESAEAYDERMWRHKAHTDNGNVIIPKIMFKRALEDVAQYLGIQIPGKGKSTYTKHFKSGVQIVTDLDTGITPEQLECETILCNADGVRGSGKRVFRNFPAVRNWEGDITICVADEIITEEVLRQHLIKAGFLIGIGAFRVHKGNNSGGFKLHSLAETDLGFD